MDLLDRFLKIANELRDARCDTDESELVIEDAVFQRLLREADLYQKTMGVAIIGGAEPKTEPEYLRIAGLVVRPVR